jgi:DNA-binding SARP family transcriptional activator
VHFAVLGPLEARGDDGHRLELGPPKQRAVLALLVVAGGRVVSLDRLVDELWAGDEPPAQATLSLQSYVARLRRILEPGRDPKRPSGLIVSRSPGWALSLTGHTVDATRFAELAEAGARQLTGGEPGRAVATLTDALALWRGEPLMEFASLPTAAVEAVRLGERRAAAVEDLLDARLAVGDIAAVVAEAEAMLTDEPYRERVWRTLVLALYRAGRQADALDAFGRARTRLADDLGLDPGPELRELEAAILRQDPALDVVPVPGPVVAGAASSPSPPPALDDGRAVPFVGRQRETASVRAALDNLARGVGQVVLVRGPAGIGKSSLLDQAEALAGDSAVALRGVCMDADPPPAFWPWIGVLRGVVDSMGAGTVRQIVGDHAPHLAVVDPALGRVLDTAPPEPLAWAELSRTRLLHGVADALHALSSRRALLIAVDDAQWADAATVDLLLAVADRVPSAPITLVVSYRDDEVAGSALEPLLRRLLADPRVVQLTLEGLDRDAVLAQLGALVGRVDDAVVDALVDRTGGNPLFLTELIRMLDSERALQPERVRADTAPPVVQQVVRRRLTRLPEQTNAVLTVAAAIGRAFDATVLGRVLGIEDEALHEALDSAIVSGLVDDVDVNTGRLRFSHDLVRQTLYDGVTGLRRARMHATIARELGAQAGVTASVLAHHYRLAAPVLEPELVVPRLTAAAAEAVDALAYDQAQTLLEHALRLSEAMSPGPERDRQQLDLHIRLGVIEQTLRGEGSPVVGAHLEQLLTLLERVSVTPAVVPAVVCAMPGLLSRGRIDELFQWTDDLVRRAVPEARAEIAVLDHYFRGVARTEQGRHAEALEHLLAGLHLCAESPPASYDGFEGWDVELGMLQFACIASALVGDGEAAERHLASSRAKEAAANRAFASIYVDYTECYLAVVLGDAVRAGMVAARMRAAATALGYQAYAAVGAVVAGWARVVSGDAAGLEQIEQVCTARAGLWHGYREVFVQLLWVRSLLALGRVADAVTVAERAIASVDPALPGPVGHQLFVVRAQALEQLSPQR